MTGTTSEVMRLFVVVLIVGNVLAFVAGVSLLFAPQRMARWFGFRSEHPLSVRRMTKPLEKIHDSETAMLRYPRVLGVALLAGGIFVLIKWTYFFASLSVTEGGRTLMQLYPHAWSVQMSEVVWLALLVLVLFGAVVAIVVGGLALVRIQTLKNFSSVANRWVSTRKVAKPISRPYYGIDRLVGAHPQVWGGVIALLSIYTLAMIAWFARGGLGY